MHKTFNRFVHGLLAWLTAAGVPVERRPSLVEWADLPIHHPRAD